MRVFLGCDHAGFELKEDLVQRVVSAGHDAQDFGAREFDAEDDYPPYCLQVAAAVAREPGSLGVVIGGSGNGEQIAANKVPGVRAALAWNVATARLAREHNDANVVAIGARMHSREEAWLIVSTFLDASFSGDVRHTRRINQVSQYEKTHQLPAL
jgi:ribose 5-phosphate isomerase B